MSFGKAKIQRFNDVKEGAPSPAQYNILRRSFKIRKFINNEAKSPVQSETCSMASSTQSTPVFRTPTVPKKSKVISSSTKSRFKDLFGSNNSKKELFSKSSKICPQTNDLEALREKTVECENKDEYINDLIEQLEELRDCLSKLKQEKELLDSEKEKFDERISQINLQHENNVAYIKNNYDKQLEALLDEKAKVIDDLNKLELEYNDFKESTKKQINSLSENTEKFEQLYKKSLDDSRHLLREKEQKELELKSLEELCISLEEKHSLEIEKLQREHQNEIQDLEFEMLKTMTELQRERDNTALKISELQLTYEQKIQQTQQEHEQEIISLKSKMGVEQIEKTWREQLIQQEKESQEILKECQAISEYNIIQCEIEKNQVKAALEHKTIEYQSLLKTYDSLKQSYYDLEKKFNTNYGKSSKLLSQLNESKKIIDEKEKEISQLSIENRAYEYTMNNYYLTIEVLKKRLLSSDRDVEQLKAELIGNEERMLECENKCVQLENELQQAHAANKELEMQFESTIRINEKEIRQLECDLLSKVDVYKQEVIDYTKKSVDEESLKNELKEMLEDVKNVSIEVEAIKDGFESKMEALESEIKASEEEKKLLVEENMCLKERLKEIEEQSEEKFGLIRKLTTLQEKYDSVNVELSDAVEIRKKYIEQSGKFDELSQKYDELQRQHKNKKETVSKELYEILLQKYEKLEAENASRKKIEKKEKLKKLKEDKENIGSPNRSLNTSRVESLFRDRN